MPAAARDRPAGRDGVRLAVLGNPGNRRVALFRAAVVAAGLVPPRVLAWRDVAAGGPVPPLPAGTLLRIDSFGEDAQVDRLLRDAAVPARHGEIVGGAERYRGLRRALGSVTGAAARDGVTLLNDPGDILTMFDKASCHRRLRAAGVPVPDALDSVAGGWPELRAVLRERGWARAFVKPRHGSSASGVIALHVAPGRVHAVTAVEVDGGRLYNSLRVRAYTDEALVGAIVDRLAPDGLHVERWFPKASTGGRVFDLRVVTVAGRPGHTVVRTSRSPMTNLHLGGARGDLAAVRDALGPAGWARAMDTCAGVAACFPGSLHTGVDLMVGADLRSYAVAEVNAFGDLLPGLLVDGLDTYGAQVRAVLDGLAAVAG